MYTLFDSGPTFYNVKGSFAQLAPLVKKYGIDAISPTGELLEDEKNAVEARRILDDFGLKWGLMPMPMDFYAESTSDEMFTQGLKTLVKRAKCAEKLGVTLAYNHIFPGSNIREFDENIDWHLKRLISIYEILEAHGIRYGLEFLGSWDLFTSFRYPFIRTISGVLSLADLVNNKIGFVFDTFHWSCMGALREDLLYASVHSDRLVCFHIDDGIAGLKMYEQKDLVRAMPMTTGIIDSLTPWKKFIQSGYDGPVLSEPIKPIYERFQTMSSEDVIHEVADSYNNMKQLAGMQE